MQRLIIVLSLFLLSFDGKGQDLPRNIVSIETGLWSRGNVGLRYARNYCVKDFFHMRTDLSYGVGWNPRYNRYYPNQHVVLSQLFCFGKDKNFFFIGAEARYVDLVLTKRINQLPLIKFGHYEKYSHKQYNGFLFSPTIGSTLFTESGFTASGRLAAMMLFEGNDLVRFRPSFGISLGYAF